MGSNYQEKRSTRWGVLCEIEKYTEGVGGEQNEVEQSQSLLRSADGDWGEPTPAEEHPYCQKCTEMAGCWALNEIEELQSSQS